MKYANGDVYDGEWKDEKKNGIGAGMDGAGCRGGRRGGRDWRTVTGGVCDTRGAGRGARGAGRWLARRGAGRRAEEARKWGGGGG